MLKGNSNFMAIGAFLGIYNVDRQANYYRKLNKSMDMKLPVNTEKISPFSKLTKTETVLFHIT